MSIRTTLTLDDDVAERVKSESRSRGLSFKETLNSLLRAALLNLEQRPARRTVEIKPWHMGPREGLNYDSIEALLEYGEGGRSPVTVLDANILLYAFDADAAQHHIAAQWLTKLRDSDELIGLPWVSIWAFLRVITNSRLWARPRSAHNAWAVISEWLDQPGVIALQPGPRHSEILKRLMIDYAVSGPLITDAVLAAIAIEYGALLASTDQDFRRFTELRWINPLSNPLQARD